MTPGLLGPACGVLQLLLAMEQQSGQRLLWCQLLLLFQGIINYIYFSTFIFSFIFRSVLIRFASQGLVVGGKPELRLFHQLYWTVFWAFFWIGVLTYPIVQIARGTFGDSLLGQVCLLSSPIETKEESAIEIIQSIVFCFTAAMFNLYYSHKIQNFLTQICPQNRMACIGKYRRNMMDLKENSYYIYLWTMFATLSGLLRIIMIYFPMSPAAWFWIHNTLWFTFIMILHGLVIPMKMVIPWRTSGKTKGFYVQKPTVLEPRRYVAQTDGLASTSFSSSTSSASLSLKPALFWRLSASDLVPPTCCPPPPPTP